MASSTSTTADGEGMPFSVVGGINSTETSIGNEESSSVSARSTNTLNGDAAKAYYETIGQLQKASTEGADTMSSDNEKYLEERFKRVDDRIEHQNDLFNSKIDRVIDKIDGMSDRMEQVENKVDGFKTHVWWAVLTLFVGLGGLLYMLAQMQQSWLQKYLDIIMQIPK